MSRRIQIYLPDEEEEAYALRLEVARSLKQMNESEFVRAHLKAAYTLPVTEVIF